MVNHGWRTASAPFGVKFWFVLGVAALLMFLEVALTAAADESKVKAGTVQKIQESGQAAEPQAQRAAKSARDMAPSPSVRA
jgi:type IV secretory pathway VirB10-like protein